MGTDTKYFSRGKLKEGCSVYDLYYDVAKYFKNEEEAKKLSPTSIADVFLVCPKCGCEKQMRVNNLINRGFSCNRCSDGISVPEKFMYNILTQLMVEFETQKLFDWSENKRYDFYIDESVLIEVQGMQHYKFTGRGKSLKEEEANDNLKRDLAVNNGISHSDYVIIDCRYSELQWMKNNIEKELGDKFDLKNIDWQTAFEFSQSSLVLKICEYWKNLDSELSTSEIGKIFKISNHTVSKYLKIGNELGLCEYIPKEEKAKRIKKWSEYNENNGIKVCQYTQEGVFIKEYKSISKASSSVKVNLSGIANCVKGEYGLSGGFMWRKSNGVFSDIPPYKKPTSKSAKQVSQYTLDKQLVNKFNSAHDAMRNTGVDHSQISACCRGENKTSNGFVWVYD